MVHSPDIFPEKISVLFWLRARLFCMALARQLGGDSCVVCVACCRVALAYAILHLYNI